MPAINDKCFTTLSQHVQQQISESLHLNGDYRHARWSLAERNIVRWSDSFERYIPLTILLAGLTICDIMLWSDQLFSLKIFQQTSWRRLLEWQEGFLAGQLTIVGVIYPLVVGLVGVLFQNKSARKILFPVYQTYSGFMFAGLSGLTLAAVIIIGYFIRPVVSDHLYAAYCLTVAMWFLSNVLLTAWFFVQTFRFLHEPFRDKLILRFSINEACEQDVRERLRLLFLESAVPNKLIANPRPEVMEVKSYRYGDEGFAEIWRKGDRHGSISDVRFWMINLAISWQIFLLRLRGISGAVLIIRPGYRSNGVPRFVLARYDRFRVNKLASILIKYAFTIEQSRPPSATGLSVMIGAITGSANDALRAGSPKDFENAVDTVVEWHTEIAHSLAFTNDSGEQDNWLLLPSNAFFARTYQDELIGEYYRLARDAVSMLTESPRYFKKLLYLHPHIYAQRESLSDGEIRPLLRGSYYLWSILLEWNSVGNRSADARRRDCYEEAVYEFVGAWESWTSYIEPRSRRSTDTARAYPAFIAHLELTALSAVEAIRFGDMWAASWGVDMLNNWFHKVSFESHWDKDYLWRSMLVNHRHLRSDSTPEDWRPILRGHESDSLAAAGIAYKNTSLDVRVLTACYMLMKPIDEERDHLARLVKALLSGEAVQESGGNATGSSILQAGDLVGSYIRQRDYRGIRQGYGEWLASILRSFGSLFEERRVSGRVYVGGWGASSVGSMNASFVEIALSLSSTPWRLRNDWQEALVSEAFQHSDREDLISDMNDWLRIVDERQEYSLISDEGDLTQLKANFTESVRNLINWISQNQIERVTDAPVDRARIGSFERLCSEAILRFSRDSFPGNLFESVTNDADLPDKFSYRVNINKYEKSNIAEGLQANVAVNEDEWLESIAVDSFKGRLIHKVFSQPSCSDTSFERIGDLLDAIYQASQDLACPVLLSGSQAMKAAVRRLLLEDSSCRRYKLSRLDGFGEAYVCHIGRCEVFSVGVDREETSLLTSKEKFLGLRLSRLSNGLNAAVTFTADEDEPQQGTLQISYALDVDLDDNTPCERLRLDGNVRDVLEAL